MRTRTTWEKKTLLLLLLPLVFLSFKVAIFFQPGLDTLEAIDPFINGNLPSTEPSGNLNLLEIHTNIEWESPQAILPFPGTNDLLVGEMDGRLYTIPDNDNADQTERLLVLDIQDLCYYYNWGGVGSKHGGFQNLVFHPEFGQNTGNDYIYIYYLHNPSGNDSDSSLTTDYYNRLSRFTWTGSSFDKESQVIMINQYDTERGHDGSGLAFGNDNFLYISVGDEGTQNEQATPNTQLLNDRFRSGVWRIDVDMKGGDISHPIERQPNNANTPTTVEQSYTQGYFIPNDNPWVTGTGEFLEEFYAIGLRQPFRMTYDPPTNNFWIGDVGSTKWEEVDIMDKPGLNFQWNFKEGFEEGYRTPAQMPNPIYGEEREPVYAYDGSVGSAVIGGYVYRGSDIPELYGKYIFGDNANGSLYALTHTGGNTNGGVETIANVGGSVFSGISSLGYNHENEIMVLKLSAGTPGGGKIFKVENNGGIGEIPLPSLLSETGVFSNMQNLTPSPGIIPYDTNNPLWSSGTDKQRWVAIPQDGLVDTTEEQIGYQEEGEWTLPIGTTFIKQFNNPDGTKLETRLWIHGTDGKWFGSTYKWRSNGLEADLLLLGDKENITIDGDTFGYEYPASTSCVQCHNSSAGWVLGFNTRQLNKEMEYPTTGRTANQLETLASLGFIPEVDTDNVPTLVRIDDNSQSLETRARSYFDSNCAYCHLPGNTRAEFDMRFSTHLSEQLLINGAIIEDLTGGGVAIAPGNISKSNVYQRLNSLNPSIMMPPLAKGRVDIEAVQMLEAWVNSLNGICDDLNETIIGNTNLTDGDFLDAHRHININKTDVYTNNTNRDVTVCLEQFTFYASKLGNPVTPFVAKVNGENEFTVISIGETRTISEYTTGLNTFSFSDHSSDAVVVKRGESIAPGFMDAYPDGSGSNVGGSLIPAITTGGPDNVYQKFTSSSTDITPHLKMGFEPLGGTTSNVGRSYQFNIGINISQIGDNFNPSVNLALGKDTEQSSTENNGNSIRAVDGSTSGNWMDNSVTQTEELRSNPWWRVDLGDTYVISEINIFNRTDCCSGRLDGAKVMIGNTDSYNPQDFVEIGLLNQGFLQNLNAKKQSARYVMIYLEGNNKVLSLAEVQVFEGDVNPEVTLFQNTVFAGSSWGLDLGEYPDISLEGITNNDVSSIQIKAGYKVELFSEKDFSGDVFVLEESDFDLVVSGFNDRTSSIKISKITENSGPTVANIFSESSFEGNLIGLSIGEYSNISLRGITLNDIGSVQVADGYVVELYPDLNFGGTPVVLTANTGELAALGIDDDAESVKVYDISQPPVATIVTLYQNTQYAGTSWELGAGEYPDITLEGIRDNDASSLEVEQGYIVELYSEKNFGGDMFTLDQSNPNLVTSGFNDKASSVKIYEFVPAPEPMLATLFQEDAFGGTAWGLDIGEYGDISSEGVSLNDVSSVQVTDGYVVELYPDLNFGGTPVVLTADTGELAALGIDDDAESVKVYEFIEPPVPAIVTLYQHTQYAGTSWELGAGEYPDITLEGIRDNDASSLEVEQGYIVELYSEKNFGGDMFTLDQSNPNLVTSGFNDKASSVKIYEFVPAPEPTLATLFQEDAFGGTAWGLDIGEYGDISSEGVSLNDVSSVQVTDGYVVELYPDLNFGGTPVVLTANTGELAALGIDDDAESVKVYDISQPPVATIVTLYQNTQYAGTSWELGAGEYPDITLEGIRDNDASSLEVEQGYIVELYSEKNFGGDMFTLDQSNPNLVTSGFNDKASSVKIYEFVPAPEPTLATLFQEDAFGGTAWGLDIGEYGDISSEGVSLNDVSSVQVTDGYVVELYPDLNFGGTPVVLTANTGELAALGIDDDAESVKVYDISQPPVATIVTLYQNTQYAGTSWELGAGEYPDITLEGIRDNDASSLEVEQGYIVELYSEKNFGGDMFTLDQSNPNLVTSGFNDKASSVKIYEFVPAPEPMLATLFQEDAFGGTAWGLDIGEYGDISSEGVSLNDVSSVQVTDGYVVELYPDLNFGGTPVVLTADTGELAALGIDDDAESVKVYEFIEPPVPAIVTLYQHTQYAGTSWELGAGEYPDITLEGIRDNDASSLEVEQGYIVELYSEKNFGGDMFTLDQSNPNLVTSGFNDKASSVKIYEFVPAPEPTLATLFQEDAFGGTAWGLDIGEYGDISSEGVSLNDVSSVQVTDGYVVELYPDLNFGGTPVVLTADTGELAALGIDDDAESVKVYIERCQCASGEYSLLINGSFEETSNPTYASTYDLIVATGSTFLDAHPDTEIPGWFATGGIALQQGGFSQGGTIELGINGFIGRQAPDGQVFVEMDGNNHNQIISVNSGQLLDWELSHQGRVGTDVISVSAGPIGNQTVIAILSSPRNEWITHTGQYQVPIGVSEIQFTITPLEASDGDIDSSNLLDFVRLCPSNGTNPPLTSLKAKIGPNINPVLPISIYPNPVGNIVNLYSETLISQKAQVYFYSDNGTLVQQQEVLFQDSREVEVNVSELSAGVYTILILNDSGVTTTIRMLKNK